MTTLDITAAARAAANSDESPYAQGWQRLVKAVFDRALGAILFVLLLAPLLAAAAAIKLSSRGPIIYRQTRYGVGGRPFQMYKFRTMVADADRQQVPRNDADGLLFKARRDPRITPVGRFLRRWSLDELPQLLNVLLGDMSLVGPRPLPVHPSRYDPVERRRLLVKPGITGLWQVNGRSDVSWSGCVHLDLQYVDNWSLALDVRIMTRTLAAVLRGAGAY